MVFWSIVASIVFTLIVLILTLITIQQGYGYKHTIDPPVNKRDDEDEKPDRESHNR